MLRQLGPHDRAILEHFLRRRPVDYCIALGLLSRYGFEGPVTFYGLWLDPAGGQPGADSTASELAAVVTLDRGRALLLGDVSSHFGPVADLLSDAQLRAAFAPTTTMDPLLQAPASSGVPARWRHAKQEVEQQMVLKPVNPVPPPGPFSPMTIRPAAESDLPRLAGALGSADRWANESEASLQHRLRYGFIQIVLTGGRLDGILFANLSTPEYPRLSRIWVRPEFRRMGVGTALVYAACHELDAKGAVAVSAWVPQRDAVARRILTKVGWSRGLLWKKVLLK